jgi:effector-binding domain-containing protein
MVLHSQTWEEDALDVEVGFSIHTQKDYHVTLAGEHTMTTRDLPAMEKMVTALHAGMPREGHSSYSAIGRWMEANGQRFAGPGRKVFITLPPADQEQHMMTEIQFPVEPSDVG